ncbi:hypothetical protein ACFZ8E_07440 [Methylobacterium sp. HMF5984]|uniref:hypothetical protein n=1 Tax=Methylobacterium sp. HMF5984 TaxID=3367370 RepID=UPI0038530432
MIDKNVHLPIQPEIREQSLVATLAKLVKLQNELRALYSALGLTWGEDAPEDAVAVAEALVAMLRGSE